MNQAWKKELKCEIKLKLWALAEKKQQQQHKHTQMDEERRETHDKKTTRKGSENKGISE